MNAPEYMMDLISYGGQMVPRGYVYELLREVALSHGHQKAQANALADRWMQGHDLREAIKARAETNG